MVRQYNPDQRLAPGRSGMGWFWPSWLSLRSTKLPQVIIVLYTRSGCHLCDDAKAILKDRQRRWGFQLRETDIDIDPELAKLYGDCVPVVTVDGKLRFRGRVEAALLDRLMAGESLRSAPKTPRRA
jgi:glutaredoxin